MKRPVLEYAKLPDVPLSQLSPADKIISGIAWMADNAEYGIDEAAKKLIDEFRAYVALRSETGSPRWIPVSERLPEQRIRVLGWDGLCIEDCFYGVSSNRSDADWSAVTWRRTAYEDHFRASHWMPLPEAPK